MKTERLTEDLLKRLLASSSMDDYLDEEGSVVELTLSSYLADLLKEKGLKRADVVRGSSLNATVVYDIFAGKSRPGRDHAIMLALGLRCDLAQTQRLMRLAGVSVLWCKNRRDAIIIWGIDKGFDRAQIDDELWRLGEKTLFATGPLKK